MSTAQIDPAKIEQAMDALLRAILENEAKPADSDAIDPAFAATAAEINEGEVVSQDIDAIIADPVAVACRSQLAALGSLLFEDIGVSDDAGEVLGRVAAMDSPHAGRRREILEEAWEHVGPEGDGKLE